MAHSCSAPTFIAISSFRIDRTYLSTSVSTKDANESTRVSTEAVNESTQVSTISRSAQRTCNERLTNVCNGTSAVLT